VKRAGIALLLASLSALSLACGEETWKTTGVVDQLLLPDHQVVIAHQNIPGLMPAMTMNFYAEPALLARLEVGQEIAFTLAKRGNSFTITEFRVVGEGAGRSGVGDPLADAADPAAPFTFTDQSGATLSLSDLRGKAVLLDFIFTHCPGPCPILTGVKAEVQRKLSPEAAARAHFVSITLDPARDTPEVLLAYATARKLDLTNWSFLTGPPESIDATLRAYGVGRVPVPGGDIQHTVATFLIGPDGEIEQRYLGTGTEAATLQADLEALL
jgi:protein SCO1/2